MIDRRVLILALGTLLSMFGPCDAQPIIHPGDTLSIDVHNYDAVIDDSQGRLKSLNSESLVVAADGSISIPVCGVVPVSGKNVSEVEQIIEARLERYVHDPSVTVRLVQQNELIFLTGATTGTLPYLPGETLSSALGQLREQFEKDAPAVLSSNEKIGGALSRSAVDLRRIEIARDRRIGNFINGEDLLRSGQAGPELAPGDILMFASKPIRVDVGGQVEAPGPIYLYKTDTLETALLAAGGPLPTASIVGATLMRSGSEQSVSLAGKALDQPPRDGDEIVVHAAPHITVLGQVPNPGELTLKNGSTLLAALYVAGGPTRWANVKDVAVVHDGDRKSYDLTGLQHGDLSSNVPLSDGDVVYVPEGHKIDTRFFFQSLVGALSGVYDLTHL